MHYHYGDVPEEIHADVAEAFEAVEGLLSLIGIDDPDPMYDCLNDLIHACRVAGGVHGIDLKGKHWRAVSRRSSIGFRLWLDTVEPHAKAMAKAMDAAGLPLTD